MLLAAKLVLVSVALGGAGMAQADYLYTHLAGPAGGPGNADGSSSVARLNNPGGIARDGMGNIFVADRGNKTIRRIAPDGTISTVGASGTGAVSFLSIAGLTADASGTLYVADSNVETIYKVSPDGTVTSFAGMAYQHYAYGTTVVGINQDGTGKDARFFGPSGLALDGSGNLYVADTGNHTVRKITPEGVVTTIAGMGGQSGSVDGPGNTARFVRPASIAVDSTGIIYVADFSTIRKITPDGIVTTLAGKAEQTGSVDGTGVAALFDRPSIALDGTGGLIAADWGSHTIRRVTPAGVVSTIAGAAGQAGMADGVAADARFENPAGLTADTTGNIYVSDSTNDTIRRIAPDGTVSTFAGMAGGFGTVDASGVKARFDEPWGVAADNDGNVYVADRGSHRIRKITADGVVSTLVAGSFSANAEPAGVTVDANGNVYAVFAGSNTVKKISREGVVTNLAGQDRVFGSADGPGANATFAYPLAITLGPDGNLYVADTGNRLIRKINPDGIVSTLTIKSAESPLNAPNGLAFDATGNLFVADRGSHVVHKITPDGIMTVLAGTPYHYGHADGTGSAARFLGPCGVVADKNGNIIVADTGTNTIRQITPGGVVSTIGGLFGIYGSADGLGSSAHFFTPHGIAIDRSGNLYIAEEWNHAVRKGLLAGPPVIQTQPQSQSVTLGSTVTLSVIAIAVPSATYQWYFNGNAFQGATSSSLSLNGTRAVDAGDYTVVVTNSLGSVTSAKATLTVTAASAPPPSSSGGGGGAPSPAFVSILSMLALIRRLLGKTRGNPGSRIGCPDCP